MARSQSRLTAEIGFDRDGKHHGFIRLPYSVHRSAYGWIPIPVACIKNGKGPRVLLIAGNHGDEYEGQVALGKLIRSPRAAAVSVKGSARITAKSMRQNGHCRRTIR
jgi:uncharacterized protein